MLYLVDFDSLLKIQQTYTHQIMKFLPLLISLTIISPNIYSNPSGADDEDIMDALIELPIHLYRSNDIFSQSGNEVITDIKINSSVDDFGDEVKLKL